MEMMPLINYYIIALYMKITMVTTPLINSLITLFTC